MDIEDYASRYYDGEMEALKGAFLKERVMSSRILSHVIAKMFPILEACEIDPEYQHLFKKCKRCVDNFIAKQDKDLREMDVDFYNGVTDDIEEWRQRLIKSNPTLTEREDLDRQRKNLLGDIFIAFASQKSVIYEKVMDQTDEHLKAFLVSSGITF